MSGPFNLPGSITQPTAADAIAAEVRATQPAATPTTPAGPAFPTGPEPGRVFGYVSFVDPTTGAEFVPLNTDTRMALGAPMELVLRFVNPSGQTQDLSLWAPFKQVAHQGASLAYGYQVPGCIAWYYDIQMNPDTSEGAPRHLPVDGIATNVNRTGVITYNPDQWRFLDVVRAGSYHEAGPPEVWLGFNRRSMPFPDLPDTD